MEGDNDEVKKMKKIRFSMLETKGNIKGNFRDGDYLFLHIYVHKGYLGQDSL